MNLNNFDGLKLNNNNHSSHDVELMMELPPASPTSHISHVSHISHRSTHTNGNGNGHSAFADDKPHSLSISRATLMGKEFSVEKSLTAMGVLGVIAIILSSLSIVLLFQFNSMQTQTGTDEAMVIVPGSRWYADILDSGVVLASFCLMLNLCCVVVCSVQSYFTAKMLKLPQGEERSCEFLKNTSGSRFLAVCSFFVSIPVFLIALCFYMLLVFRMIPATVSSALIGLAILFMIFCFGHSVHLWRKEQSEITKRHVGAFELNGGVTGTDGKGHRFAYTNHVEANGDPISNSNLSTLV